MATAFPQALAVGRAAIRDARAAQSVEVTPEVGVEQPVDDRIETHGAEGHQHAAGVNQGKVAVLKDLRKKGRGTKKVR